MSPDSTPVTPAPVVGTGPARKVPRRTLWVTSVAAGTVLVAGLAAAGWSWRHPAAFTEAGGWGVGHKDLPLGVPLYLGMSNEDRGTSGVVSIHAARPHVVSDSASARIEFFVCTIDESAGVGAIGTSLGSDIHDYCSALVPAEGATLELNADPPQQLVMAVSLTNAGRVQVQGIDLDYSDGWQRGTQRIGGDVRRTASHPLTTLTLPAAGRRCQRSATELGEQVPTAAMSASAGLWGGRPECGLGTAGWLGRWPSDR